MRLYLALSLMLLPVVACPGPAATACQESALPPDVRHLLGARYPGWHVVQPGDLLKDDQALWSKAHPDECPGLIRGTFMSGGDVSYALLLLRREGARLRDVLVVASLEQGTYRLHPVGGTAETASTAVITRASKGSYLDAERKNTVVLTRDGIIYEKLEAGAVLYYWDGSRFLSMQLSE